MYLTNMTFKKLQKTIQASLSKLRKIVLWIPVLTFIAGLSISYSIYNNLNEREQGLLRADSVQRYKEMINQLDLIFSNSILRIQSYEDYLGSKPSTYKENIPLVTHSLAHTIFQRFSVFHNSQLKDKDTGLPIMKLILRVNAKNSTLAPATKKMSQSKTVLQGIQKMIDSNSYQMSIFNSHLDTPLVSFVSRLKTNRNIFFIFTAPLLEVFSKTDLRPGESLDITDTQSGFSWRVETDEHDQKIIQAYPKKNNPKNGFHHYLYIEGLPQSGMKLNFAFNFKELENHLSPAVIAGLMSLLITIIISYLFFVLIRQNSLVTRLVIEKTHDLEKAHHELQEVLLGKSRFLGNISHEIRTPLNLILGMIDLCEEEDREKRINPYLTSMRASGNHLLSMIEDLLDLAKSDSNDLQIHPKKINLIQFLDETSRIAGQDFLKKGIRFYTLFAADLPLSTQFDPSRLRQILMNLLRNACKYTNSGHVIFRVSNLGRLGEKTKLRFEVEDTGVGIPEDKLGKVFDSFFQVENSYVLAEGGVGLGLAIVKELVRKLGGSLDVKSQPKKGSVFQVDLEVDSVEPFSWLEIYKAHEEIKVELILVSTDQRWVDSISILCKHKDININQILPENALAYLTENPATSSQWILIDAAAQGISSELIKTVPSLEKLVVVRNKKNILATDKYLQFPILDNSPVSVTDILNLIGFSSRAKKVTQKTTQVATDAAVEALTSSSLSLIVADDDIGNKELYMAYFEKTKWQIGFAMNGKEAWDLYLEAPSDLLVLDLRMPVMDGFEVVEKVRNHEIQNKLPSKPILLVTADALDTTAEKALGLPNVSFLTKPIKKSVLFESIQQALK